MCGRGPLPVRRRRAGDRQDATAGRPSERAGGRGCLTLQGGAAEFERELPFGAVVDALDEHLESLDPRAYQRLAAEELGELAGVFPPFARSTPDSLTRAPRPSASGRTGRWAHCSSTWRRAGHWSSRSTIFTGPTGPRSSSSRICCGALRGRGTGGRDVPQRTGRPRTRVHDRQEPARDGPPHRSRSAPARRGAGTRGRRRRSGIRPSLRGERRQPVLPAGAGADEKRGRAAMGSRRRRGSPGSRCAGHRR